MNEPNPLVPKPDAPLGHKLRTDMIRHRRKKRLRFVGFLLTGGMVGYVLFMVVFHGDVVRQWIKHLFFASNPFVVVAAGLIGVLLLASRWADFYVQWKTSQREFKQALLEYKTHIAEIEGGELSFALIEHQQGELTTSPTGKLEVVDDG